MMKSKQKSLLLSLFTCSTLFLSATEAAEYPLGWYVGGELGRSSSNFDIDDLNQLATAGGLNVTSSTIDDTATSYGLLVGYQFNEYLALEGGYRDIGEYSSEVSGTTTDPASFNQIAGSLVPQAGDGGSLGVVLSYPIADAWKLSGKVGFWDWDNENHVSATTTVTGNDGSGTDIYYGAELSYQISDRWQTYFSAVRYDFDRDESNNLSLGLRYFFGKDKSSVSRTKPSTIPAPTPVASLKSKPEVMAQLDPRDNDGDGVLNDEDQCVNTPHHHQVDNKGCTLYEEVKYQHQLLIKYPNNSSMIDDSYLTEIQQLVDFAKDKGIKYIQVVGHTSLPGTKEYNQWLSEQRAKSLQTILVERHGYSVDQIETLGKGEQEPVAQGNSETAHSQNRRIEVNLSATGKNPKTK